MINAPICILSSKVNGVKIGYAGTSGVDLKEQLQNLGSEVS
jgi:hypothetical protein